MLMLCARENSCLTGQAVAVDGGVSALWAGPGSAGLYKWMNTVVLHKRCMKDMTRIVTHAACATRRATHAAPDASATASR
jgi:hypothetical protein